MKKRLIWFLICLLSPPVLGYAYVTLQSYSTGETLTASKLNSNQNALNTGLDNLLIEMKDSITAVHNSVRDSLFMHKSGVRDTVSKMLQDSLFMHKSGARDTISKMLQDSLFMHKSGVRDTVAKMLQDSSFVHKTDVNDSINVRLSSTILLPFSGAAGDSFYAGDSLTVEISRATLLGDAATLFVKSATSVIEKVKLFWDVELPNSLSKIDSIRTSVWTERTTGVDFASLYVRDDSTRYAFKAAKDSTGSQYSATARTLKVISQAVSTNSIVGGRFRIEAVLQLTNSDSMFVGPIELVVSNR